MKLKSKRFVAVALCLVMALSGCGSKPEPGDTSAVGGGSSSSVPKEPRVTAEELLAGNYGVDTVESVTLSLLLELDTPEYVGSLAGVFEQTGDMFHLAVDEVSPMNVDTAAQYDIYYSISDETLYEMVGDEWQATPGGHRMGFDQLISVPASELVENGTVLEKDGSYIVTGTSSSGVVADLMKFMPLESDVSSADITTEFSYAKDSRMLESMRWKVQGTDVSLMIDADVSLINETAIVLPFDKDSIEADSDDFWDYVPGVQEDEVRLSEAMFDIDYVTGDDFLAGIPEQYRDLHEGVLYMTRWYINSYSKEGFIRMLSNTTPEIEEELGAAVLLCELADIPVEPLWESGFMGEEDVSAWQETLGIS